jgi:hypothetical protein
MIAPLLSGVINQQLSETFPFMTAQEKNFSRNPYALLEASARTLAGVAPWLESEGLSGIEQERQMHHRIGASQLLAALVDPSTNLYGQFKNGNQPLVEAAFLAQALMRAPRALWVNAGLETQSHILKALHETRAIIPKNNNWLLFSALIEAFFCHLQQDFDANRINLALQQFERWYVGDGFYADGPSFKMDYYNSIVIHPMLMDILILTRADGRWVEREVPILERAQRYAGFLLEMTGSSGQLPRLGRSLCYRTGLVHLLSYLSWGERLPNHMASNFVQNRLTQVIQAHLSHPQTYDKSGWLTIGFQGYELGLAESYISRGSLYAASFIFLPLGLGPHHPFWID